MLLAVTESMIFKKAHQPMKVSKMLNPENDPLLRLRIEIAAALDAALPEDGPPVNPLQEIATELEAMAGTWLRRRYSGIVGHA